MMAPPALLLSCLLLAASAPAASSSGGAGASVIDAAGGADREAPEDRAAAGERVPRSRYPALLEQARRRIGEVKDFTCWLHARELDGGTLAPESRIQVKWRRAPRAVYLRIPHHKDREVIWQEGWRKLRVHTGDFMDLQLSLDPRGSLAMKGSRHPVTEIGFDIILDIIERTIGKAVEDPAYPLELFHVGPRVVHGAACDCYQALVDKDRRPDAYGRRMLLCVQDDLELPVLVEVEDLVGGELRVIESYGFEDVKVNQGLQDLDFDPENPAYGF